MDGYYCTMTCISLLCTIFIDTAKLLKVISGMHIAKKRNRGDCHTNLAQNMKWFELSRGRNVEQ
jgi:hypothetical protein